MGVVIHDDFWEAAQCMPEKQRAPFLYAILEYRFAGVEPKGNPPWLPTFMVIRKRMDMADAKSAKGREMANARWGKRRRKGAADDAAARGNPHAGQDQSTCGSTCTSTCTDDAAARGNPHAEVEVELGVGENPPTPLGAGGVPEAALLADPPDDPRAAFLAEAMAAWSEVTGQQEPDYPSPETSSGLYRAFDAGCTVDDVRLVARAKLEEWGGDAHMGRMLRPGVVFGDRFGEYLAVAKSQMGKDEDYGRYD